jgi:ABC-2 type transport system ATP-binding protein
MSRPCIVIRGLRKRFREGFFSRWQVAVDGVDLQVGRGECWGLVGPNGAGKTTTLGCLLGFVCPDAGVVLMFDKPPADPSSRAKVGFQDEIFRTDDKQTAAGALSFYGKLSGLRGSALQERIGAALDAVELTEARDRRIKGFSKGMVARLGLAQSLLHAPEMLIWDEPTSGLDPEGRRLVTERIAKHVAAGGTMLLSSHILGDVERSCDHVAIMARGRIALSGRVDALREAAGGASLEDIYMRTMRGVMTGQSHA